MTAATIQAAGTPRAKQGRVDDVAVVCARVGEASLHRRLLRDIALAGFNDMSIARYVTPALNTVRVSIADLGRSALEHPTALLENYGQDRAGAHTFGCEIVVRQSGGDKTTTARHPIKNAASVQYTGERKP